MLRLETLLIKLLGKEVEISKWDNNEVTFTQGNKYLMKEGETVVINGKNNVTYDVKLSIVTNGAAYVVVNGKGKKIPEGRVKNVGGIEIKASNVIASTNPLTGSQAELIIGEDVEFTINNGDEYKNSNIWEWQIDNNSIGLKLSEAFTKINDDYNALSKKDVLCLPENYICISYNGLDKVINKDYTFELSNNYVKVKGNFLNGLEDFNRIFINSSGIYDKKFRLINNETIKLSNTDSILNITSGNMVINDLNLTLNLSEVYVGNMNVSSKDEDYLTSYGVFISNPKSSIKDKFLKIKVPEEKLQGSVSVKIGTFT